MPAGVVEPSVTPVPPPAAPRQASTPPPRIPRIGPSGVTLYSGLGTRDEVVAELRAILAAMNAWWTLAPDDVMIQVSAFSARLTELSSELWLAESQDRQYTRLRTMMVAKMVEAVDQQFKVHSRRVELLRQDLEMARG